MAEIVNTHVSHSEFSEVVGPLQADDFCETDFGTFVWMRQLFRIDRDTLLNAFSSTARDRREVGNRFYHFLKYRHAYSVVEEMVLQFTAMKYFRVPDHAEYSGFLERCAFSGVAIDCERIDSYKRRLFVLCLTKEPGNDRFWTEYADRDWRRSFVARVYRIIRWMP